MNAVSISANVICSVGGFIAGYAVCRIGQRVDEIWTRGQTMNDAPKQSASHRFHISRWQVVGVVVIILALASTITTAMTSIDQRRIAECQAGFNKAYRLAIIERTEAAAHERAAMRTMLGTLLDVQATAETRRKAVTTYYEALQQADQTRDANPLPATDSCR